MTPTTRDVVWTAALPTRAREVEATPERLSWAREHEDDDWPGTEGLLDAFTALAKAEPEEMATFLEDHGVPELCALHGRPDRHPLRDAQTFPSQAMTAFYCPLGEAGDGARFISPRALRLAARAVDAARSLGAGLRDGHVGRADMWHELQPLAGRTVKVPPADDWRMARRVLAEWLEWFMQDCGVAPRVSWPYRRRLVVNVRADGLLGVLAILLVREVGRDGQYLCDVCGQPFTRERTPRLGESICCGRDDCVKELARRRQARRRGRQRTGGAG